MTTATLTATPTATPTPGVCGDGTHDPGEECDDGNVVADDGCSPTCTLEPCGPAPALGCRAARSTKGLLKIKVHSVDGAKNELQWKWLMGAATTKSEFGDPVNTADYVVCLYDGSGLLATLTAPAGGTCAGKLCWASKPTGFQYKDKDLTPDGLAQVWLGAGADGKAKIQVIGKGLNLPTLDLQSLVSPVTVQIKPSSDGLCWGATYSFPPATKNDATQFKDKAD
jgi:cysteine-rich repeat protein